MRAYSKPLTSSSCGELWLLAEGFFALWAKKRRAFHAVCAYFRPFVLCAVVSSVTFSGNLSEFEYNPRNPKILKNLLKRNKRK